MGRKYWYYYQGTGNQNDASNYIKINANPNNVCISSGTVVCAVYTSASATDQLRPQIFSDIIQDYIILATSVSTRYPIAPQKAYVYTQQLI